MDVLHAMRVFIQVADAGNFSRAAEQLGASVPTITRLIGQLEERLNVRLFQRTTRRISLTDAGATYLEGCRRALELIEETESQVVSVNSELRGRLRVMSGSAVAFSHMAPAVSDFVRRYPFVRIDFFTMDNAFSLVDEAVDIAILADYLIPSETVVARRLITYSYVIVATPEYLSGVAPISNPADLKKLCFLGRPTDGPARHDVAFDRVGKNPGQRHRADARRRMQQRTDASGAYSFELWLLRTSPPVRSDGDQQGQIDPIAI